MHNSILKKIETLLTQEDISSEKTSGSFLAALIGALIGAFPGAFLWAAVYYWEYPAYIVGFFIGVFVEMGYRIFRGPQGKEKLLPLFLCITFGIFLGTFSGDMAILYDMVRDGAFPGMTISDIPSLFLFLISDTAYIFSFLFDLLMGLIFSCLGICSVVRRAKKKAEEKENEVIPL